MIVQVSQRIWLMIKKVADSDRTNLYEQGDENGDGGRYAVNNNNTQIMCLASARKRRVLGTRDKRKRWK